MTREAESSGRKNERTNLGQVIRLYTVIRIKGHYCDGSSGTADADRFLYNHDDAGNRLYRDIALTGQSNLDRDQEYTYDGLYRLT